MRRSLCTLFAGVAAAVALASTGAVPAHAQKSWACDVNYYATCYSPSLVRQAERAMPVQPVDPSRTVFRVTHLRLARVTITRNAFNMPPHAIFYSYGVALDLENPYPQNGTKYVLVVEFPGRPIVLPGAQVYAMKGGWRMVANFPHRKLTLTVYGNVSRQAIRSIGQAILSA